MSQISYDEVNLMLRLYDLRREPRLREARAWFVDHFHAGTPEEVMQKYPQGSQENTYIRMVISYWEMVAGIVNRGPDADHRAHLAGSVQESHLVFRNRRSLQAAGSLARAARSGIFRGHAADDGALSRQDEVTPGCPRKLSFESVTYDVSTCVSVVCTSAGFPIPEGCATRTQLRPAAFAA